MPKQPKCIICKKPFKKVYSTTQNVCSTKCAIEHGKTKVKKVKTGNKEELEKIRKDSNEIKKLSTLIKSVINVCHKYIRLRDEGKPCISCGFPYKTNFQAGHFYKAELFSTIKFNEYNINGQCIGCNIRKDGNESEYRIHLPDRIGKENFKELDRLAKLDHSIDFKWDRDELIKIRKYYNNKLKHYEHKNYNT